jgi:hypothetical protein
VRRLISGHRLIGPGPGDPWQELAVAVLLRASLRLRRDSLTGPEAVTWLRGPGDDLAHALGWPAGVLRDYDPARVDWRAVSPCPTGHLIWPGGVGLRLAASAAHNAVAVTVHRTCNGVTSVQRRCIGATG